MILALKDLTVKFSRERIHTNEIVGGKVFQSLILGIKINVVPIPVLMLKEHHL